MMITDHKNVVRDKDEDKDHYIIIKLTLLYYNTEIFYRSGWKLATSLGIISLSF